MPHAGLPQKGRGRGKCPDAARLLYQCATLCGWWAVSMLRLLPGPSAGTLRNLQHSRGHAWTPCVRSRCGLRHETRRPGHYYGAWRRLTASQSRTADIVTTAAVSGRSAAHSIGSSHITGTKLGTATTGHSLSPSCLVGGRTTAPGRHAGASVRFARRRQHPPRQEAQICTTGKRLR